ncbi:MAG: 4-hydroxy-3-methylbut-2-enyl diphosphate reductase [Solobacterium sp.]|nr:4-hydroxy-3-methylbut-2-enyl diphosphate reductase [Solobacterium sp.]
MEIISVNPRGYCLGVIGAIELAKKTIKQNPNTKISMLGMIVHNRYVVEYFTKQGVICLDDSKKTRLELLDEIEEGIVIITAHGASDEVFKKATKKGLIIVDATCPDVKITHQITREHVKDGDVIYIGKRNHPEAEGTVGISNRVHLVSSIEDIQQLPPLDNILITNQTTLSIVDIKPLIEECLKQFPNAKVTEEICKATRIRQEAITKLEDVDVLFVVGDPHSNNSNQLCTIGKSHGIKDAYLIEGAWQIQEDMIKNKNRIAVTSGSSTPTLLTNSVIEYLENYAKTNQFIPAKTIETLTF